MKQNMQARRWNGHSDIILILFGIFILCLGMSAMDNQTVFAQKESKKLQETEKDSETPVADVLDVKVSGKSEAYRFAVKIASPDEGCQQYADWWEVLTEDGALVYRRILAHSHVDEQPFVRSGGPVEITAETVVFVRAHMSPGGYGGQAMEGTVQAGFEAVELAADFAPEVETEAPQPAGCAF